MDWQKLSLSDLTYFIEYCLDNIKNSNPNQGSFKCCACQKTVSYLNTNGFLDVWCSTDNCINFIIEDTRSNNYELNAK